jgi:hypothetical protein
LDDDGNDIPITERFTPQYVEQCVEITNLVPLPEFNWTATQVGGEWVFVPYVEPPLTPQQILVNQSAKLVGLKQLAEAQKVALSNRIGTLNDAIELEMATPAEIAELPVRTAQLKAWKTYAVLLGRVTGQAGWPPDVEWPVQPAEGMDLTTSATAPDVV